MQKQSCSCHQTFRKRRATRLQTVVAEHNPFTFEAEAFSLMAEGEAAFGEAYELAFAAEMYGETEDEVRRRGGAWRAPMRRPRRKPGGFRPRPRPFPRPRPVFYPWGGTLQPAAIEPSYPAPPAYPAPPESSAEPVAEPVASVEPGAEPEPDDSASAPPDAPNTPDAPDAPDAQNAMEWEWVFEPEDVTEAFLGKAFRRATRAVGSVAKTASRTVGSAAKGVGKAASTVGRIIPVGQIADAAARMASATPLGMATRAAYGAIGAAAQGKNVFRGAVRSLAPDPGTRFLLDTATGVARGENIWQAAKRAGQAGIHDVRERLRFAEMVAPFIPGVGTGIGAALGAANALANGRPITDALIAAARGALPGGKLSQTAFDTAVNLARGKNLAQAALEAARAQLPGGPAAKAAFDAAIALGQGKNLQEAAWKAAGKLMPPSPYAADALAFAQRVTRGENLQTAALSVAGNRVRQKMQQLQPKR